MGSPGKGWFTKPRGSKAHRRDTRYETENLSCYPLGNVIDLSASGMRVRCKGRPPVKRGSSDHFALQSGMQKLKVLGQVVWVRRKSLRMGVWEFGVHFTDQRAGLRTALINLAQYGFVSGAPVADGRGGDIPPPSPGGSKKRPGVSAGIEVDDLYAVLGVPPEANDEQVRAAYRTLARALHPDVCKAAGAAERFALVGRAYSVLKDPKERQRYDDLLRRLREVA
jgi:hypothetical protein